MDDAVDTVGQFLDLRVVGEVGLDELFVIGEIIRLA